MMFRDIGGSVVLLKNGVYKTCPLAMWGFDDPTLFVKLGRS